MSLVRLTQLEDRLTPAATLPELVYDAQNTPFASSPGVGVEFNGFVYFAANGSGTGRELWRSDGTSAGTSLVKDIIPGTANSFPYLIGVLNGKLFFSATALNGTFLWQSDGTSAGTVAVTAPGGGAAANGKPVAWNSRLYFPADELWVTDGTSSGTHKVRDINGSTAAGVANLTLVGDRLYFSANDGVNGTELWSSDGTSAGTTLVKDTLPGSAGSGFRNFTNVNGRLYFGANQPATGYELWTSDGTAAGTNLVLDVYAGTGSGSFNLANFNGTLAFSGRTANNVGGLWTSDGTSGGTVPLSGLGIPTTPVGLVPFGTTLLVNTTQTLYRTDGTAAGTTVLASNMAGNSLRPIGVIAGSQYFASSTSDVWQTDGTPAGTRLLGRAGANVQTVGVVNGKLLVQSTDERGAELWIADDTGVNLVRDIYPGSVGSSSGGLVWLTLAAGNGGLFFTANNTHVGEEWYYTNGTSAGTTRLTNLWPSQLEGSDFPRSGTVAGSTLYFSVPNGSGTDLWASNGTSQGTLRLMPLAISEFSWRAADVNGTLFFTAGGAAGVELWRSDGTVAGTTLVKDIQTGGGSSNPSQLRNMNGVLMFAANDGVTGTELWKSDGTPAGTTLVADLTPGPNGSGIKAYGNESLSVIAGGSEPPAPSSLYYFTSMAGGLGNELWRSDGTSTGTFRLADINPGTADGILGSSDVFPGAVRAGDGWYFSANDGVAGFELWATDGTAAGTRLVKEIHPGGSVSSPRNFQNVNGTLYFSANSPGLGYELWKSNGTSDGTVLVRDISAGTGSGVYSDMRNVAGILYFTSGGPFAKFIWRSDGTSAGTTAVPMAAGITNSSSSSQITHTVATGDRLYFSAYSQIWGNELFLLREDGTAPVVAGVTSTSANGTYTTGQPINVKLTFSEPVTLAGGNLTLTLDTGGTLTFTPQTTTSFSASYTPTAGHSSPDLRATTIALTGSATLRDAVGNAAVLTLPANNLDVTANLLVNPLPPTTVSAVSVNFGDAQRSRVTTIALTFATPVDAAKLARPGVIMLSRSDGGTLQSGATSGGRVNLSVVNGMVTSVTLTFDNADGAAVSNVVEHGSLADGRWTLASLG